MKTSKMSIVLAMLLLIQFSIAQETPSMFVVHTDNVKFEKVPQYETLAKNLKENCEKLNIKNINWTTISIEDGRYVHVSPIKNMAELDENPMKELSEKMDKTAFSKLFDGMDECYDSHSDAVIHHVADLSYKPESAKETNGNHREYHFLYYPPKNGKAMKEAMAKVKELFKKKGIKNGYDVYHSGFGSDEGYYMVAIAGENELQLAQEGKENRVLMGEERGPTFFLCY